MNTSNVRWPDSLWAAMTPSGPELTELTGTQQTDVIVIGAGFTGLSTALHLREAGVDVAIVEAAEPGWGASGRNNGQVIPTLSRPDPEDIVAQTRRGGRTLRRHAARQRLLSVRPDEALQYRRRGGAGRLGAAGAFARPHQDRRTPRAAMVEVRRAGGIAVARADPRTCWAPTPGSAASGTRPAATSIRWPWRAASRAPCSASVPCIYARSPAREL